MPIAHRFTNNVKTCLNGTYHGVSTKHLPRYPREWSYRFNRRSHVAKLGSFLLRRITDKSTITYDQLVAYVKVEGAT